MLHLSMCIAPAAGLMWLAASLQVGWLVDAEMVAWSDGIGRQFHRHKKAQAKLALAYQEVRHCIVSYMYHVHVWSCGHQQPVVKAHQATLLVTR